MPIHYPAYYCNGERRRASTDATFEAFEVCDPHTGVLASIADLPRLRMITELQ